MLKAQKDKHKRVEKVINQTKKGMTENKGIEVNFHVCWLEIYLINLYSLGTESLFQVPM